MNRSEEKTEVRRIVIGWFCDEIDGEGEARLKSWKAEILMVDIFAWLFNGKLERHGSML